MTVSKSTGSPFLVKDSEVVEGVSEDKTAISESPLKNYAGSGHHIVYVRRKHETELGKSNIAENQIDDVDNSESNKFNVHAEMKNSVPDVVSLERASSPCFSSSSVSPNTHGMSSNILSQGSNVNVNKNIHVKSTRNNSSSDDPMSRMSFKLLEERFCRLQSLLKRLDESDQDDYVQMLRSLSSVELSRHAVELEKRSIKLSLEEAKELQRVRLFDVLGKYPNNEATTPHARQEQLHK